MTPEYLREIRYGHRPPFPHGLFQANPLWALLELYIVIPSPKPIMPPKLYTICMQR